MDNPQSAKEHDYADVRTLLSWTAPGRPFSEKGRQYYLSIVLIVILVETLLFLFSEYQLMVVVVALAFLAIALASVAPKTFHYRISTEGIKVEDYFYIWGELYDFYFKKMDNTDVLIVRTEAFLPGELKISLGDLSRDHVRQILVQYIPYREYVKPSFMEKAGEWLAHNFPLERAD